MRTLIFCGNFLFPMLLCLEVYAQSNTFSISPGIRFFDYAEYGDDGSFLDGEKGPVPGIGGVIEHRTSNNAVLSVFGDIFLGKVNYDGHLQSGLPLSAETDQLFYSVGVGVQTPGMLINKPLFDKRIAGFTNIIYQVWEREILPTQISSRLFEIYSWWELSIGGKYFVFEKDDQNLVLFGRAFYIINPTMQIDLASSGYGKPVLDLGEKTGGEVGFEWLTLSSPNHWLGLTGAYKFWGFGRSDDQVVFRNDNTTSIVIHEPRSETNNFNLQAVIKINF
ncbi:MAG TPA: hypothetical protein VIM41_13505 [Gammaproteobacteria bacterium]